MWAPYFAPSPEEEIAARDAASASSLTGSRNERQSIADVLLIDTVDSARREMQGITVFPIIAAVDVMDEIALPNLPVRALHSAVGFSPIGVFNVIGEPASFVLPACTRQSTESSSIVAVIHAVLTRDAAGDGMGMALQSPGRSNIAGPPTEACAAMRALGREHAAVQQDAQASQPPCECIGDGVLVYYSAGRARLQSLEPGAARTRFRVHEFESRDGVALKVNGALSHRCSMCVHAVWQSSGRKAVLASLAPFAWRSTDIHHAICKHTHMQDHTHVHHEHTRVRTDTQVHHEHIRVRTDTRVHHGRMRVRAHVSRHAHVHHKHIDRSSYECARLYVHCCHLGTGSGETAVGISLDNGIVVDRGVVSL